MAGRGNTSMMRNLSVTMIQRQTNTLRMLEMHCKTEIYLIYTLHSKSI